MVGIGGKAPECRVFAGKGLGVVKRSSARAVKGRLAKWSAMGKPLTSAFEEWQKAEFRNGNRLEGENGS